MDLVSGTNQYENWKYFFLEGEPNNRKKSSRDLCEAELQWRFLEDFGLALYQSCTTLHQSPKASALVKTASKNIGEYSATKIYFFPGQQKNCEKISPYVSLLEVESFFRGKIVKIFTFGRIFTYGVKLQ